VKVGDLVKHFDGSKGVIIEKVAHKLVKDWGYDWLNSCNVHTFRVLWTTGHVDNVDPRHLKLMVKEDEL
tara:strand:- start:705 stop:911 length:207 start_codon:yes stop_codon:yes gene_type:complete